MTITMTMPIGLNLEEHQTCKYYQRHCLASCLIQDESYIKLYILFYFLSSSPKDIMLKHRYFASTVMFA